MNDLDNLDYENKPKGNVILRYLYHLPTGQVFTVN